MVKNQVQQALGKLYDLEILIHVSVINMLDGK